MRVPIASMTKHLQWTRSGTIWATWRLQGLPYAYGTGEIKKFAHLHHQELFQGLTGEALLMGLCANEDPVNIADRMLAGIPIEQHPQWAEEVTLTLDALEEIPVGTRAYWLSVPLPVRSFQQRAQSLVRAVDTELRDVLALPRAVPGDAEVEAAEVAADQIERNIPGAFEPRRATPAELVWIAFHSQQRGLGADQSVPGEGQSGDSLERSVHYLPSEFPAPFLDEGGASDVTAEPNGGKRLLKRVNPFGRRWLKVQGPYNEGVSYQALMALAGYPKGGWSFPGVEWISRVEDFNFHVDWAVRLQVKPGRDVKRRNKRAERNLHDQVRQQEDEDSSLTGGASDLDEVAEALSSYHRSLNRSEKEVEVQATTIFAVGASDPDVADAQARFIADDYKASEFLMDRVFGKQEELWWAMQPGTPSASVVREFAQITTGREFATAIPMITTDLGDEKGLLLADNISTERGTPVLLDVQGNIEADASGSIGIAAELGAGKSVMMKKIAGDTIDRGGRVFIIDRTPVREYAHFARSLIPEHTAIVDLTNPRWSLDPLRMFGPKQGARHVQSLFASLLGVKPRDTLGVTLSRLLSEASVRENKITSLGELRNYVSAHAGEKTDYDQLSGLIDLIAEKDFGAVLFDDALPPLALESQAVIALTDGLSLPDKTELMNKHLFDEMPLEKIFGRSMYALLTSLAREICFSDPTQLANFFVDECHHVTASPEGERDLQYFFRDGRKHGAAAIVASHDPHDFGDERTRGLIKTRIVMRQTDTELASRALDWLADLGEDDSMLEHLTKNTSPVGQNGIVEPSRRGEAFMRDIRGRIGKIHIRLPARESRRNFVLSTPTKDNDLAGQS